MKGFHDSQTDPLIRDLSTTPDCICAWAGRRYGCDVDLAARRENKKFAYYYSDIIDPLDADCLGDGLIENWRTPLRPERRCGYLNPPYSDVTPWIAKAANEAANGFTTVMLLPTLNGEVWGRWVGFAREVIFIIGRIQFLDFRTGKPILGRNGKPGGNNRGSMLVIFGPHSQEAPSMSFINLNELK